MASESKKVNGEAEGIPKAQEPDTVTLKLQDVLAHVHLILAQHESPSARVMFSSAIFGQMAKTLGVDPKTFGQLCDSLRSNYLDEWMKALADKADAEAAASDAPAS